MNNILNKKLASCVTALVIGGFAATTSQAAFLVWDPTTNDVTVGDTFDVNVHIGGLLPNENLAGFDFDVNFDDSMLDFAAYTLHDGLGDISVGDADDWSDGYLGSGTASFSELSWLSD